MKTYTITQNGSSNGNAIAQPFTIEVHMMIYRDNEAGSRLDISVCTKNGGDDPCDNDDIPNVTSYDLPAMSTSKNNDLSNTLEVLLEEKYPGKWS